MAHYTEISPDQFNEEHGPDSGGQWTVTEYTKSEGQRTLLGISDSGLKLVIASLISVDRELCDASDDEISIILSRSGHGYYPDGIATDFGLGGLAYVRIGTKLPHTEAEFAACGNKQKIMAGSNGSEVGRSFSGYSNPLWSNRESVLGARVISIRYTEDTVESNLITIER